MAVIGFIFFGLLIGLIARTLMPGDQPMGWVATALLGVVGSMLGGAFSGALYGGRWNEPHTAGWVGSVLGALIVLGVFLAARRSDPVRS